MSIQEHSAEEACERAALYAVGALRDEELRQFEAHLRNGCDSCSAAVAAFETVAADLAYAATTQTPRAAVGTRVLERVAAEDILAGQAVFERGGVSFVRPTQLRWEAGTTPGIDIKTLSTDRERGYITKLVRMPPGSALRPHRHADVEESYVLEGDLLVSGVLMRAGDYCRADAGSVHTGVATTGGCVFIAVCSERDELLA